MMPQIMAPQRLRVIAAVRSNFSHCAISLLAKRLIVIAVIAFAPFRIILLDSVLPDTHLGRSGGGRVFEGSSKPE